MTPRHPAVASSAQASSKRERTKEIRFIMDKAIDEAVFVLERIDKKWPVGG